MQVKGDDAARGFRSFKRSLHVYDLTDLLPDFNWPQRFVTRVLGHSVAGSQNLAHAAQGSKQFWFGFSARPTRSKTEKLLGSKESGFGFGTLNGA